MIAKFSYVFAILLVAIFCFAKWQSPARATDGGLSTESNVKVTLPRRLNDRTMFSVPLRNEGDNPVTVVGVRSDCNCVHVPKLPITVGAHCTVPVDVSIELTLNTIEQSYFVKQLVFFHNESRSGLAVTIECRVED